MSPENTIIENSRRGSKSLGFPYFCLFSVQTAGVGVLVANIVPLYRMMALDFSNYRPDARPWWAMAGILLAQAAYWYGVRLKPSVPGARHLVLGHIVSFIARILFVSVTASFTVMFLNRFPELRDLNYPPVRILIIILMFFSIFCWTLELERLAKALQEPDRGT